MHVKNNCLRVEVQSKTLFFEKFLRIFQRGTTRKFECEEKHLGVYQNTEKL